MTLTAWRLAYMICYESGPLAIFARLRKRYCSIEGGGLGELLHCVYCVSVYTALLCLGLWAAGLGLINVIFAASQLELMLASWTGAGYRE